MAAGQSKVYNVGYETFMLDANRAWDDSTAGSLMWVLVDAAYNPSDAHTTANDFGGNIITGGDGAPMDATDLVLTKTPGSANETFFQAGANASATEVTFGDPVTIDAQYLALIQPVVASTYATTAKLIFYVDLTDGGGNLSSSAGEFTINMPANGWFKMSQA